MNGPILLAVSTLVLVLPLLLSHLSNANRPKRPRPEIHGALRPMHWMMMGYCGLMYRLRTNGWAPLPEAGPALLIANHTCGIDHMILQAGSRRVLGFMIAREYYEWDKIHWFCKLVGCIPVNRDGRDIFATRTALRALEDGRVVPIFPEGKITPSSGRELGEIRPGAAYLAVRSGVPVIPAYITGTPLTNQIGESLKTRSRAFVRFGPPLDLTDFHPDQAGDKEVLVEVSRRFREAFLALRAATLDESDGPPPVTMSRSMAAA
ncbi:MAG: lysophospholipid acyltransferase family protein [Isosphaeraceae bacterium]